jgi:ABC-type phosphate transport system substrate-binding protein
MRKILTLAALLAASASFAEEPARVRVIVNPANRETALSREQVSRLFLRKQTSWPSGGQVDPVDQRSSSAAREKFVEWAHHRSPSALSLYWQQQVFSGRGSPPPEKAGDAEVIEYVAQNPGAVGYVSAGAKVGNVRVLAVTE